MSSVTNNSGNINHSRKSSTTPAPLIVRALYDYHSPDSTNLSFQAGTLIRVLTQLQSGWWDGCIDGERGWFPCNFVTEVDSDALVDEEDFLDTNDSSSAMSGDEDGGERALTGDDDDNMIISDEFPWMAQVDSEGRTYFLNTQTGVTSWELPSTTVFLDDWDDDDDLAPRSSIDSENSEDILMLGPSSLGGNHQPSLQSEYNVTDFTVRSTIFYITNKKRLSLQSPSRRSSNTKSASDGSTKRLSFTPSYKPPPVPTYGIPPLVFYILL
jgi:SH3 domain/WW domain